MRRNGEEEPVQSVDAPAGYQLQVDESGRIDGLGMHSMERTALAADEVEVRVSVAGLNFCDVLKTMGRYPGQNRHTSTIGVECTGVVTDVGEDVYSVSVGQRVLALGEGAFGSHLTTLEDLVVAVPDKLTDVQAVTFGLAYLTAWHALREVGRLAPGERVLIHSASGGVGMAAIAIAKMIGARIYCTAGSAAKRAALEAMGVEYVGDSRSLQFADDIRAATDGQGVDVIINSLAGQAIAAGMEILAPGGRFVELGRADVYADGVLHLGALARSGSFAVVDMDMNLRRQPWHYRQMLDDILTLAVYGDLTPLPVTTFDFAHTSDAFALMAAGKHTGKIVITVA